MKSKEDNLDVDKLKNVPTDLNKLSDVANECVLKKLKYNINKQGLHKKIEDVDKKYVILVICFKYKNWES